MSPSTSSPSLKSLKRHPLYYFPGTDMKVIAGDTGFRVPSIFFTRESQVFRERISEDAQKANGNGNGKGKGADSDICSDYTVIIEQHENVTPDDFAELCSIFYNPKFSIYEKSLDAWTVVLRLANQWGFGEVKNLAFRELETPGKFPMSLVERIILYQKYHADRKYIGPLYEELLARPAPLSQQEGEALGLKSVIEITAARDELLRSLVPEVKSAPLPSKMKDAITHVAQRLLGLSTTPPATANGKPPISVQTKVLGLDKSSQSGSDSKDAKDKKQNLLKASGGR